MRSFLLLISLSFLSFFVNAQGVSVSGTINSTEDGKAIAYASVCIEPLKNCTICDEMGRYTIEHLEPGNYKIVALYGGYYTAKDINVGDKNISVNMGIALHTAVLDSVSIKAYRNFGANHLKDVDGAGIYAGKKSEVIVMKDINANTATNNARQIYASVAGLNIWENDGGAGIQLAIGSRGLDPNRVSNFNTRQNGYDISADALGYPESYYTPPAEMVDRIEVVRGAASLQYGTQFGGIINFKLNEAPDSQKVQVISRLTLGSWAFLNSSTSIGGTMKKWKYYAFYQHKSGEGWRPNSGFNLNAAYLNAAYNASRKLSVTVQYTHMDYLEQQAGGLSDLMFAINPQQSTKDRNWFKVNWNLGAVLLNYQITDKLQFDTRMFGLLAERSALGIITTVVDPGGPRQYRTDAFTNWGNESRLLYTYNTGRKNTSTLLGGVRYYNGYTNRQIGDGNDGYGGAKADFSYTKATLVDSLNYSQYKFPNHNTSVFAENIFRLGPKFSVIPGARYEHIVTTANGFYNSFVQDHAGNVIYNQPINENRISRRSFVIGGLGVSYVPRKSCEFYANISQNYRSINFNDMSIVNPNYRVDPNLRDEKGYSADAGVRGQYKNLFHYDLSVFIINYANRIGNILQKDTSSPNTYRYTTNVSQSRNYGVESFAELDVWKLIRGSGAKTKLFLFSNFSWIDARYVNSKETAYENKKVEFVPEFILKTGLTLKLNKLSATWQYAYTSEQFTDATNSSVPTNNGINGLVPAYYVMDLTANYKINAMFSFSGTISNLSNNRYYTRRADSYPGPGIIPADARSYYLTIQVKL